MMNIETRCFEIQKHFLKTGKVLPELHETVASETGTGCLCQSR